MDDASGAQPRLPGWKWRSIASAGLDSRCVDGTGSAATVAAAVASDPSEGEICAWKALEAHGLVELGRNACGAVSPNDSCAVQRGIFIVAPDVFKSASIDPNEVADGLSGAICLPVSARTVSEVGAIASSTPTRNARADLDS